jgi:hypothetical protein
VQGDWRLGARLETVRQVMLWLWIAFRIGLGRPRIAPPQSAA